MTFPTPELRQLTPTTATIGLGRLGLVSLSLPLFLDCARIAQAARAAAGFRSAEETVPSAAPNSDAQLMVGAAALALALTGCPWSPPRTFRACGRDVIDFGHAALDDLVRSGRLSPDYNVALGLVADAGAEVVGWVSRSFHRAHDEAEAEVGPFVPTPPPGGTD